MRGIAILVGCALIIVGVVISFCFAALRREWMKSLRKWRAMRSGAPSVLIWPEHYQPRNVGKAWREPIEFEATKPCPHCGFFDTHNMAAPTKHDHVEASTVRRCHRCGHVWGEK